MKILIAYDGSACSEAAVDDLVTAGLPEKGEAEVITVAQVWLPPPGSDEFENEGDETAAFVEEINRKYREHGERALREAEMFARHGCVRVQTALPGWKVTSSATYGSPAWEILTRADEFKAGLIVLGSNGQSELGRLIPGSISQKVLTEAHCSVRIARDRINTGASARRILIAFDGSRGAKAAVDAVTSRRWPEGSEVRLVTVSDPVTPSAISRFVPPMITMVEEINVAETKLLKMQAAKVMKVLSASRLHPSLRIYPGNPKSVLVDEAENWSADCVFLGANSGGCSLGRFLIGSTTTAVAARAQCSVEVVRTQPRAQLPSSVPDHSSSGGKI